MHNTTTMEWKEYEELTKNIYETLGKESGVKIEGYGNDCKMIGKSTVAHQIDVLTSHTDGLHTYKTAIECKYWDKNINKDIIMKVAEIVEDASLSKGVIVCKHGFTPDAVTFAKYKNVGLIELRELTEDDWKGRLRDINIKLEYVFPEISHVEILIDPSTTPNFQRDEVDIDFFQVRLPDNSVKEFEYWIDEFSNKLTNDKKSETTEETYEFEKGTFLLDDYANTETEITGIKLRGHVKIIRDKIELKGKDHVYMVMKHISENQSYTIFRNGDIKKRKS